MENKQNSTIRGCTKFTEVLLVTANVGSLFEDPKRLLKPWLGEFLLKVSQIKPKFIALHLQEVGGKTYEKSMEYVQEFIKHICEASDLSEYSCIRIYMDEDYKSAEHFTALGNLYFTHKSLNHVKIWNYFLHTWESALDKNIYSGNIEAIVTKEKSKFPQHFFPECKWSRKGFMRTRWEINGTVIDLVNIHLFHDASNLVACEEFPSVYCKTRRRALVHTLEKFHTDTLNGLVPFFIFGDFNFRCDTKGVIKKLAESLSIHRVYNIKHDSTKMHYRNADGDNVLTVGKKEFIHADHQLKFKESWLHEFDRELEALREVLVEYPIKFPPTYPYEEDPEMPTDYMSTRCPAWCDRILMSLQAREIIENEEETDDSNNKNPYNTIGEHVCMGDHKPIYLHFKLKTNQGIYSCCQCHLHFANTNKSTSLNRSASIQNNCDNSTGFYCHYNSQVYTEILIECSKLNCNNIFDRNNKSFHVKICTNLPHEDHSSLIGSSVLNELKLPQVSINVFDSDNINVCMCSRKTNYTTEHINGLFCPECGNLITRQNLSHRCTLTSKRLMLSNDIIVNRIDTQYLNTYSDFTHQRQEPYTPESAESHSPYPELNSSTTTSCNSRSTFERHLEKNHHSDQCKSLQTQYKVYSNENAMPRNDDFKGEMIDTIEMHRRGIVTPGQLKSRLEDLQRSSLNLYDIHGEDAGKSDVENVGKICQPNMVFEKPKCSCLPGCCKIS